MTTPEPKRRWYRLTPDRFVIALLVIECLLWLSDRFQWLGFNHHKGWPVLIAVAAVVVAGLAMLLWWAAGLIFHWRFQFGIRSLLAFCLACSIAVAWLGVEMRQARRQQKAVESIRSLHVVNYDWEFDANHYPIAHAAPTGPGWLRKMLGDDFFSAVVSVGITQMTDAGVENLKGLTNLEALNLMSTSVTDVGLEHLKGLTKLQVLILQNTQVTDAGLEHLKGLTNLQTLVLSGTQVTDAGVKGLQKALPKCRIDH